MPNVHKRPAKAFRPDPGEYAKAKTMLASQELTVDAFLNACLRWFLANPAGALDTLQPYGPTTRQADDP